MSGRAEHRKKTVSMLGDINMRLATPLMIQTVFVHCAVTIGRVATSYKAVELDLSVPFTAARARNEGLGIALISAIRGTDPTALTGLPLIALTGMLRQAGVPFFQG